MTDVLAYVTDGEVARVTEELRAEHGNASKPYGQARNTLSLPDLEARVGPQIRRATPKRHRYRSSCARSHSRGWRYPRVSGPSAIGSRAASSPASTATEAAANRCLPSSFKHRPRSRADGWDSTSSSPPASAFTARIRKVSSGAARPTSMRPMASTSTRPATCFGCRASATTTS